MCKGWETGKQILLKCWDEREWTSRLKWNATTTNIENPEEREEWLKITRIIEHPRTNPIEIMGVSNPQAMIHLEEHNSGNMHYNCEPCNDLGSCSHTTHTSHSTGHKYAFHIRKRTISYMLSFSSDHQAQGGAFGQKLLIFSKTLITSQKTLCYSLNVLFIGLTKCCVWEQASNMSL